VCERTQAAAYLCANSAVRFGQKQTFAMQNSMSALPPIADMCSAQADVRFVPIADILRNKPLKQKDRLAAVSPKFNLPDWSRYQSLPLPAPAEQTQRAEAAGEEREHGRQGCSDWCRCENVAVDREIIPPADAGLLHLCDKRLPVRTNWRQ
jgi:hypothetical protein